MECILYIALEEVNVFPSLPSERISRMGVAEFIGAAATLVIGVVVLQRAGLFYLERPYSYVLFLLGIAALFTCGALVFRIVRRGEYPWIFGLAAIALPLFQPSAAPYRVGDRVIFAVRDFALLMTVVLFVARSIHRADELERRVHVQAVTWSYTAVVVGLVSYAMAEDVLPALHATWLASAMLASWVVAWVYESARYQR
jgi:hypothetical protein